MAREVEGERAVRHARGVAGQLGDGEDRRAVVRLAIGVAGRATEREQVGAPGKRLGQGHARDRRVEVGDRLVELSVGGGDARQTPSREMRSRVRREGGRVGVGGAGTIARRDERVPELVVEPGHGRAERPFLARRLDRGTGRADGLIGPSRDEGQMAAPHACGRRVRDDAEPLVRGGRRVDVTQLEGRVTQRREGRRFVGAVGEDGACVRDGIA